MLPNSQFCEVIKPVVGLAPITPSGSTPDYVSLKNVNRMVALIMADNGATVTVSAITVKQATDVAGTGEKAVSFTKAYKNEDIAASDTLVEFTVASDTFNTLVTDNKNLLYAIEITPDMLDFKNGFDCVRIGTGNAANTVIAVLYLLHLKNAGPVDKQQSAIVD